MKTRKLNLASLDPAECPFYLLTRASLSITSELKKAFTGAGIGHVKPAYLGVLICLWLEEGVNEALGKLGGPGGIKTADLGRRAGLEPSTMTGVIDRMERDGLVRREDDPEDRRAQIIRLTDEGARVRGGVVAAMDGSLISAFAGVNAGQLAVFIDVLRTVLVNTNRGEIE